MGWFSKKKKKRTLNYKSREVAIMHLQKAKNALQEEARSQEDLWAIDYDVKCIEDTITYLEEES